MKRRLLGTAVINMQTPTIPICCHLSPFYIKLAVTSLQYQSLIISAGRQDHIIPKV